MTSIGVSRDLRFRIRLLVAVGVTGVDVGLTVTFVGLFDAPWILRAVQQQDITSIKL